MSFFSGFDDEFSGWPWGFAPTRRGGGFPFVDPYERKAYPSYPGTKPSQNSGRKVPPPASYDYGVPVSDPYIKRQNVPRPRPEIPIFDGPAVKKQAAQNKAPQVTRIVPISTPESPKARVCRFVAKEDAAVKIQSVFRGYSVRHTKPLCSLRKIAEIKAKLVGFNQVSDPEKVRVIRENMKERIVLNEGVMNLLLQLDSIQGVLPIVREIRKATVREIVQLQERIDSIVQQKELDKPLESELESSEGAHGEMELEQVLAEDTGDVNMTGDHFESAQDTGEGDNLYAAANTGAGDNLEAAQNTGEGDNLEAAQNTGEGDNLEAAQNTGAVNMDDNLEAAQDTGAVNIVGENLEALVDPQVQGSEKDAAMIGEDQDVLKTEDLERLTLEETDGEKLKEGTSEPQTDVQGTRGENAGQGAHEFEDGSPMELEAECRRIVDAMVDEAVEEGCASRKRDREEDEEMEASDATGEQTDAADKAGTSTDLSKIMVKLVDENVQLKKLVAECLKQTELQNALICHLNERVQKLEKKAKRKCSRKKDAKLPDLF